MELKRQDKSGLRHNLNVISIGSIPELLALREAVLQKAGFEVISRVHTAVARLEFPKGKYDVLLLCHSLARSELEQLMREFHESSPEGRVVVITNERLGFQVGESTRVVFGIDGPETLIEALRAA